MAAVVTAMPPMKVKQQTMVKGKAVSASAELLSLMQKMAVSQSGEAEIGMRSRLGQVSYRPARVSLRSSSLLVEFGAVTEANFSPSWVVAVPLDGASIFSVPPRQLELHFVAGGGRKEPCLWLRLKNDEELIRWRDAIASASRKELTLDDFEVMHAIGKGGMGSVFLARHRASERRMAIKVIPKSVVFNRTGHLQHIVDERLLLELGSDHPFVVKLQYAFQSDANFFLATEFCEGGDLYHLLKRRRRTLSERMARQIASEVVLALESMHAKGCIYRDLKPDNVLIDAEGHVRLADFGLSKVLQRIGGDGDRLERTNSFCGTAQYTPPEMLQRRNYDQSVDVWCLGVFLYEIIEGTTPFYTRDREEMYSRIQKENVRFSTRFSPECQDLLRNLLSKSPRMRFTLRDVKNHAWFRDVDWERVLQRSFWPRGVYNLKERRDVAAGADTDETLLIDADKYRDLSVDESPDAVRAAQRAATAANGNSKPARRLRLSLTNRRNACGQTVPGFSYTCPNVLEEERQRSLQVKIAARAGVPLPAVPVSPAAAVSAAAVAASSVAESSRSTTAPAAVVAMNAASKNLKLAERRRAQLAQSLDAPQQDNDSSSSGPLNRGLHRPKGNSHDRRQGATAASAALSKSRGARAHSQDPSPKRAPSWSSLRSLRTPADEQSEQSTRSRSGAFSLHIAERFRKNKRPFTE